jgi:hypothetical protein
MPASSIRNAALLDSAVAELTLAAADLRYVQIVNAFTQVLADARYVQIVNAFTQALADARYPQSAAPLVLTGQTTATTATIGAASALPGVPASYVSITINGTARKIPVWNP